MSKIRLKRVRYGVFRISCDVPEPDVNGLLYLVYRVTNLLNNKWYIGQHQTSVLNDGYPTSSDIVRNSILKHGAENFSYDIIHAFRTYEEMNSKEAEMVTADEVSDHLCYNIQAGGKNALKSDSHRNNISESLIISLGRRPKPPILRGKNGWETNQGMANPQADRQLRLFARGDMRVVCTQSELRLAYDLDHATLGKLMRGERKTHKGWSYLGKTDDASLYTGPMLFSG